MLFISNHFLGTLGMLQNEKTPVVQSSKIENPVTQSSDAPAKAKKNKKKKKKAGEGKDNQAKELSSTEETSKHESTELVSRNDNAILNHTLICT